MSHHKPTLGKLKKSLRKGKEDDPTMDAGVNAALLFGLMWGVGHAVLPDTTWYGAVCAAIAAMFGPVVVGAMIAGAAEDGLGTVKAGVIGFTVGLVGAALTALRWYPAWMVPLTLLPALGVFFPLVIKAVKAQRTAFGFDAGTTAALAALPDDLPQALRSRVDAAMRRHSEIAELAQGALLEGVPRLPHASAAAVRALARQVDVVHRLGRVGESETLRAAHQEALASLDEVEAEQMALLEAAGLYLTAQRDDRLARVHEQAEHLRLTAAALTEIEADVER
ncbi:MAG: hypothetical protein KC613_20795 [Myxococcales bacterium]|nr:hypothetical protein [Myxococcales bacterium]MCB9526206.1 hypothetical protein [Myxococcales bacterium]